jgi:hypothetical protein
MHILRRRANGHETLAQFLKRKLLQQLHEVEAPPRRTQNSNNNKDKNKNNNNESLQSNVKTSANSIGSFNTNASSRSLQNSSQYLGRRLDTNARHDNDDNNNNNNNNSQTENGMTR